MAVDDADFTAVGTSFHPESGLVRRGTIRQAASALLPMRSGRPRRRLVHNPPRHTELERDLIRERTHAGLQVARARGLQSGRPGNLHDIGEPYGFRLLGKGGACSTDAPKVAGSASRATVGPRP
ncbi:hypothetical protein GCM10011594_44140 [Nakamurella endophytica]|uniref:Resolvase/invertase-type recombinase catalytic domain-containing protein n=1 Tax=Nakamurella endophytica TaxID=1748367 RepID=A0A917WPS9_9ACTN|nr:hypothetical protein GCM10011594_44140 [Nakamurella endophytica]